MWLGAHLKCLYMNTCRVQNKSQGIHTGSSAQVRRRGCALWKWAVWIHGAGHHPVWSLWVKIRGVQWWVSNKDWLIKRGIEASFRKLKEASQSKGCSQWGYEQRQCLLKGQNGRAQNFQEISGKKFWGFLILVYRWLTNWPEEIIIWTYS